MYRILFIDDDRDALSRVRIGLHEYEILCAAEGCVGIDKVRREAPDLVLLDWKLPDMDGLDVLKRIKAIPTAPPVIMVTGFSQINLVVTAIKSGATDYVTKPYKFGTLRKIIQKAFCQNPRISPPGTGHDALDCLVGESPAMARVKECVARYADSDLPVLIFGESGTGKELIAAALHSLSSRYEGPYVTRNCGAIPVHLLESELLGSERGAYTDAPNRAGSFEQADRGTLFLDEIGEMAPAAQVKLLRILESGEVTRLGGSKKIKIDVRVVSATNRDLMMAIETGDFRQDLLYRLNTLMIPLPPLRDRLEDIPLLAMEMLRRQGSDRTISSGACERLQEYGWPGNVRELRNVIARAELLATDDAISPEDISFDGLILR